MAAIINKVSDRHTPPLQECRNEETSVGPWKTFTTLRALLVRPILAPTHILCMVGTTTIKIIIDWWVSSPKMKQAIPSQPQPNYSGKVQNVMTGDDTTHLMVCKVVQLGSSDN